jgi:anthranilate phosphoribosyltransferase
MGVRTLFNLLGPLSNPAKTVNQLIGVFSPEWVEPLAQVLKKLGSEHVVIVNAEDGLDEISIASATHIAELKDGIISSYQITPEQFGFNRTSLDSLAVDGSESSLAMLKSVLNNESGTAKDIVILNAGAAIYAANLVTTLDAGMDSARQAIETGAALEKFNQLIAYT